MLDKYEVLVAEKEFEREFGQLKYVDAYKSDSPEIWQKWWANRVVGNDDDGPWNSPQKVPVSFERRRMHFWTTSGKTTLFERFVAGS